MRLPLHSAGAGVGACFFSLALRIYTPNQPSERNHQRRRQKRSQTSRAATLETESNAELQSKCWSIHCNRATGGNVPIGNSARRWEKEAENTPTKCKVKNNTKPSRPTHEHGRTHTGVDCSSIEIVYGDRGIESTLDLAKRFCVWETCCKERHKRNFRNSKIVLIRGWWMLVDGRSERAEAASTRRPPLPLRSRQTHCVRISLHELIVAGSNYVVGFDRQPRNELITPAGSALARNLKHM